jgi:Flp pilus assembly protein TadD
MLFGFGVGLVLALLLTPATASANPGGDPFAFSPGFTSFYYPFPYYYPYLPQVYFRYPYYYGSVYFRYPYYGTFGYYGNHGYYGAYSYGYQDYSYLFMPRYYTWPKYDHSNPYYYPNDYGSYGPYSQNRFSYQAGPRVSVSVALVPSLRADGSSDVRVSVTADDGGYSRLMESGILLFRSGKYAEASRTFLQVINANPDDAYAYFSYAHSAFAESNYAAAAEALSRGLQLKPDWVCRDMDRRDYYENPKDFDRQLAALEAYVKAHPRDDAAQFVLAYNYYFSDRRADARRIFERLRESGSWHHEAKLFLKRV